MPPDDADVSTLRLGLLSAWEKINAYDAFASGVGPPPETLGLPRLPSPLPEESQLDIARRWASIFREEIETVRLVRNAVAHARPISEATLREAARLADRLLSTLHTGLAQASTDLAAS
ncbi:MAG: hypothetical protein M3217_06935 [Actinomycetota bacterium]|nr:hypothetical protein [Actinomycetota bacterium]